MKRSSCWSLAVPLALTAALLTSGCAEKQVRQEGQVSQKPPVVAPEATARPSPVYRAPVRETPMAVPPETRPEPPPVIKNKISELAAAEPAPRQPVEGAGLSQATSSSLQRVHFDYDQSTITAEAREVMTQNAQYLTANPGMRIRVEGHCDERGTTEYNLALGERRAKAAFQYLMDLGVDPNRMTTVSYGEEVPLDPSGTEAAWAKNRRAEFVEVR